MRFTKNSKRALAIALAAVMAIPTATVNPLMVEAGTIADSMPTPVATFGFGDDDAIDMTMAGEDAAIVANPDDATDRVLALDADNDGTVTGTAYASTALGAISSDFTEGVTISMDVRPTAQSIDWNYLFCLGYNGNTDGKWCYVDGTIGLIVRKGDPYAAVYPGAGFVDGNPAGSDFTYLYNSANVNKWNTITYVYGKTSSAIYINGVLTCSWDVDNAAALAGLQGGKINIGCGIDPALENYSGYVDDVKIYNTELSASQVKYLVTGVESSPISGITVNDTSMKVGDTLGVKATYAPADTTEVGFTLASSDSDVVNVVGTNLVAVAEGTATITATSTVNTSISDTFTVTVAEETEFGKNTATSFEAEGYLSAASGYEKLVGDFNITYTFTSKATLTDANDRGFLIDIKSADNKRQLVRSDAWQNSQEIGTPSWVSAIEWGTDFANWREAIKDLDVTANIVRQGDVITVDLTMVDANSKIYTATCTITGENVSETLFVQVIGNAGNVSDIELRSLVQTIGAQVNTDNNADLGFVTTIDKEAFAAIGGTDKGVKNNLKMGILVKNSANPTTDAMVLENASKTGNIRQIETDYVAALTTLDTTSTDADTYAFRSVITGITDKDKEYTAVAYVTYTIDGTEYTVYGPEITRSINDVMN